MGKIAAKEGEKRPLPGSYSEMYPNRFLKSDMLKGAKVTLTIKDITGEGLMSEDKGANLEWIVSFKERDLQFVMNKTNAFCLYRMFGGDPHSWVGKRVTWFPTTTMAFGSKQDCIRVWGSPDIAEDMQITVPQGRKKAWEATMHKTATKEPAKATAPADRPSREGLDPRILTGLNILGGEKADEFLRAHKNYSNADMLSALNRIIDEAA